MSDPKVISLPTRQEEEGWPPELLEKLSERLWLLGEFIECHGEDADIAALLRTQKEIFELMTVYWAGLAPSKAEEVAAQAAPKWVEFSELAESNREKAKELLMRRGRAN
jgi:hypothetical protein